MFQEMMPMSSGGGSFNAASGDGPAPATAGEDFVIHTGLSEVTSFMITIFVDAATDNYGVASYCKELSENTQLNYGHYSSHYSNELSYPNSSTTATAYPIIKQIGYNGVAGDVLVKNVHVGNGNYYWCAS